MFDAFARLLAWFYDLVPSYGVAIILLTITVRLVLYPVTAKQARSMQAMQRVQPELKRLQQKHKNDRQKLNEEMMKFYKEHHINPLAGCLPLLLQMPLFIILYRVIRGLTHTVITASLAIGGTVSPANITGATLSHQHISGSVANGHISTGTLKADVEVDGKLVGRIRGARIRNDAVATASVSEIDGTAKVGTIKGIVLRDVQKLGDPAYVSKGSALYRSLRDARGNMRSFGMNLSQSASESHGSFVNAFPFYLLIALVVGTGYFQQRQMTARNPQAAANPQAQLMGRIFPAFFGIISLSIPAGVVLYFIASNLWQIGQQALIFRHPPEAPPAAKGEGASPKLGGTNGGGGGNGRKPRSPAKPSRGTSRPERRR